jgi:hypothetical protein
MHWQRPTRRGVLRERGSPHLLVHDEEGTVYEMLHADYSVEPPITVSGSVALRQWLTMQCSPRDGKERVRESIPFHESIESGLKEAVLAKKFSRVNYSD